MYASIHQFEPLLPASIPASLTDKAGQVAQLAIQLSAAADPTARDVVRELVRSMNSYYSNRIEGQGTHPRHIEAALRKEFSDRPDVAKLQRVALAHIDAELELELRVADGTAVLSSEFLIEAHRSLYSRLSEADRITEDGRLVVPGALRNEDVEVGLHIPPAAGTVPQFLQRMDQVYDRSASWETALIAIACLHQRAAWVHPFLDGNGRAIRLQSHCALWRLSGGLWSPGRGLARAVKDYYAHLHNADLPRKGDLDGRGNLTTAGLLAWIDYFLGVCLDQVSFMRSMLALDGMKRRIDAYITFQAVHDKAYRREAILPLYHAFAAGPLTRKEFAQMTGLGERTARSLLSKLIADGLLKSDTPLGPVRFGLPLDALLFLFPQLYPEASTRED